MLNLGRLLLSEMLRSSMRMNTYTVSRSSLF
jgi:hypothetical protein